MLTIKLIGIAGYSFLDRYCLIFRRRVRAAGGRCVPVDGLRCHYPNAERPDVHQEQQRRVVSDPYYRVEYQRYWNMLSLGEAAGWQLREGHR